MRLAHYELSEPIEFAENEINTIVIENPVFFRRIACELIDQVNGKKGDFILSEDNGIIDIAKTVDVISDLFRLSFDSRAILSQVSQAVTIESQSLTEQTESIRAGIVALAQTITSKLDFNASFNDLFDIGGVLKLLNFSVAAEEMTFCEKLIDYISFLNKYMKKRLFIIYHLKSCLDAKELDEFYKIMQYKKINILLLESSCKEPIGENEKMRIIDKDLCEII